MEGTRDTCATKPNTGPSPGSAGDLVALPTPTGKCPGVQGRGWRKLQEEAAFRLGSRGCTELGVEAASGRKAQSHGLAAYVATVARSQEGGTPHPAHRAVISLRVLAYPPVSQSMLTVTPRREHC